jgi:hypothetical protein
MQGEEMRCERKRRGKHVVDRQREESGVIYSEGSRI